MPRNKDHEKNRLEQARLKKLSLLHKNTKLKRPSDPEQAKEWLRNVANHLSNFINAGPSFRFVAYAIKRFLRGSRNLQDDKARNLLYQELGLVEVPGRRWTFMERMKERERGHKIVRLKHAGKPWHTIGEEVGLRDKRSLMRIYKKHSSLLTKVIQLAALDRAMKEFFKEESLQRSKSS